MRAPIPLSLLASLLVSGTLGGCGNAQEMDLTFFNAGAQPLFVQADAESGMAVSIEVQVGEDWVLASPSLARLCVPRCGVLETPACPPIEPEVEVVQAIAGRRSVTRHLDGVWWYVDPVRGCAKPAPMDGELRAGICHDDVAVETQTGALIAPPETSGLLGLQGGAHLQDPFCETFTFDLWLASADSFDVRAQ